MLSRRSFFFGTTALVSSAMLQGAKAWPKHGVSLNPEKRSSINANGPDTFSYAFIDHLKQADSWMSPVSNSFTGLSFSNYVDSNGWPNSVTASGKSFGGGPRIPGSDEFSGPWVLTWTGDGTVVINGLPSGATWTQNTTSGAGNTTGTYTWNGSNAFTNVSGQTAKVVLNLNGCPGPILLNISVSATGGAGGFLQNLKFYRYEDEADLLAGKIFRTAFKQTYINNNPHHVRFLDWTCCNDNLVCRFEHRNKPSYASWFANFGACGQPVYGSTSGTRVYTLSGVTGTPTSMQHGEMVTCRIGNTVTGPVNGQVTVTGISQASSAVVTANTCVFTGNTTNTSTTISSITITSGYPRAGLGVTGAGIPAGTTIVSFTDLGAGASSLVLSQAATSNGTGSTFTVGHGFSVSDVVIHHMWDGTPGGTPAGMTQLNNVPCTITAVTTLTYTINVNTSTGFSTFTAPAVAYEYVTLQVGSGSDRTAYPVVFNDGVSPIARFGSSYLTADNYMTFTFDKLLVASTTVNGAWVARAHGGVSVLNDGVPLEICVAFINELMAMNPKNTIHMYYNIPPRGMISTDPDYTAGSHYGVNAVTTILNGANGYSGLDSRCNLYIEHANETWNNGTFDHAVWMQQVGYQTQGLSSLGNDLSTYSTIRAKQAVIDVQASFSGSTRIKYVMGMFSALGASDTRNQIRTRGNSSTGTSPTPLSYFDYIAIAGYFDNASAASPYDTATCASNYFSNIGNTAAQETSFANYAKGFSQQAIGGSEQIDRYVTLLSGYATEAGLQSKRVIGYEGGIQPPYTTSRSDMRGTFHASTSLTGIDGGATLTVGYYIVGTGIPAFTTISSSSAGSATLSAATSNSGLGFFTVLSPNDYFILQFKASQSWATTYMTWFNAWNSVSNADAPAEFITFWVNYGRWSHTFNLDSYSGTTEGGGFDLAWQALSARNKS